MANTKQTEKRARQSQKLRSHNQSQRSAMRTHIKKTLKAVADKDTKAAQQSFQQTIITLDRMDSHGIIHRNKAARLKSRLNAKVKALKGAAE